MTGSLQLIQYVRCAFSGSMFASLASIQVLGSIIAVTTQNPIYSATVSIMNGFVFLMMAGICGIDFILLV